jgi:hypothetical protein
MARKRAFRPGGGWGLRRPAPTAIKPLDNDPPKGPIDIGGGPVIKPPDARKSRRKKKSGKS